MVYYVKNASEEECVIKFYFKEKRYNREIFNLLNLKRFGVKVPKVLDYGILEDGVEWIKSEFIIGEVLEKIFSNIKSANLLKLYESIGEQLGKIHSAIEFNCIVDFNDKKEIVKRYENVYSLMNYYLDSAIIDIRMQNLQEVQLLDKVYEELKSECSILKDTVKPCLCHNDFGERNIMVSNNRGEWEIEAIIDFENCISFDKDFELTLYYLKLKEKNLELAKRFRYGYEKYLKIDDNALEMKRRFYRLYIGFEICSWAKKYAPNYYNEGLRYIEENL